MNISIKSFNILLYILTAILLIGSIDLLHNIVIAETIFFILFLLFWLFVKAEILNPIRQISDFTSDRKANLPVSVFSEIETLKNKTVQAFAELDAMNNDLKSIIKLEVDKYEKANGFLKKLFNNTHEGILIHDTEGNITDVNDTTLKMFGASTKEDMLQRKIIDISTHNNPLENLHEIWSSVLNGSQRQFEWEAKKLDGKAFFVAVFLTKVDIEDSTYILANINDISESKKQDTLVKSIINLQENMVLLASGEQFLAYNDSFAKYFCFADIKNANEHFHCLKGLFLNEPMTCEMPSCNFGRKMRREENRLICERQNGQKEIYLISISNILDEERYIVSLTDITDMELEKEALEIKTSVDHLTSLKNRAYFDKALELETTRAQNSGEALSLIMFDIDKFKNINDTYGHTVGDEALRLLSKIVSKNTRRDDIVARYGGEEFAIVAPNTPTESAFDLAEKIRRILDNTKMAGVPHFTCSFGIATWDGSESLAELVKRADSALYAAKEGGRNKVIF